MWSVVRDGTMPWRPRYAVTMSAGMPFSSSWPSVLHAGADDAELDRVEHAPAVRQAFEAMPVSPGCRTQQFGSVASCSAGAFVKWNAACRSSDRALRRHSTARRTSPSSREIPAARARPRGGRRPPRRCVSCVSDLPARAVHHGGGDVVRRDQRVQRRGARLRAVRFVESSVIDGAAAVADVDVRGLRQRRQQLVRRMRRENRRAVLRMRRRVAAHREAIAVHRIEARVAVPRFVEMDAVDALREPRLARRPRRSTCRRRCSWSAPNRRRACAPAAFASGLSAMHFAIALGSSRSRRNRADDAVAIAGRAQEHRDAAGDRQTLLDGLVAIAIAQRDFVVADARRHDGAVRRGGAVQHRSTSGARRRRAPHIALALADRAAVAEQRAERAALDAHVGAKQVLAVEVEEHAADRRLQERDAALVAGRRPRVFALAVVARQRRRVGRQQRLAGSGRSPPARGPR